MIQCGCDRAWDGHAHRKHGQDTPCLCPPTMREKEGGTMTTHSAFLASCLNCDCLICALGQSPSRGETFPLGGSPQLDTISVQRSGHFSSIGAQLKPTLHLLSLGVKNNHQSIYPPCEKLDVGIFWSEPISSSTLLPSLLAFLPFLPSFLPSFFFLRVTKRVLLA